MRSKRIDYEQLNMGPYRTSKKTRLRVLLGQSIWMVRNSSLLIVYPYTFTLLCNPHYYVIKMILNKVKSELKKRVDIGAEDDNFIQHHYAQ